jgi:hypothetical protein
MAKLFLRDCLNCNRILLLLRNNVDVHDNILLAKGIWLLFVCLINRFGQNSRTISCSTRWWIVRVTHRLSAR